MELIKCTHPSVIWVSWLPDRRLVQVPRPESPCIDDEIRCGWADCGSDHRISSFPQSSLCGVISAQPSLEWNRCLRCLPLRCFSAGSVCFHCRSVLRNGSHCGRAAESTARVCLSVECLNVGSMPKAAGSRVLDSFSLLVHLGFPLQWLPTPSCL